MSKALKCDRCGCCFDPMSGKDDAEFVRFQNPYFQTAKSMQEDRYSRRLMSDTDMDQFVDLCPACTRDFEAFMRCDDSRIRDLETENMRLRALNDQYRMTIFTYTTEALIGNRPGTDTDGDTVDLKLDPMIDVHKTDLKHLDHLNRF